MPRRRSTTAASPTPYLDAVARARQDPAARLDLANLHYSMIALGTSAARGDEQRIALALHAQATTLADASRSHWPTGPHRP